MTHSQKDTLWFLAVAAAILAFLTIPNWVGAAAQNEQVAYRGMYADLTDHAANLAMMRSGAEGAWMYQMRFTSEAHPPAFVRMFYILLGHISRWTNIRVEIIHEGARWLLGIAALYAIYNLCRAIFPKQNFARAAFLLASLGAGAGWAQLLAGAPLQPISPIDFWLIDAYVFFSISLFPAFSYSLLLTALGLKTFLAYLHQPSWKRVAVICLLAIASQITNPIAFALADIAFVGAVLFHWARRKRIEKKHIAALAVIALSQIPLLVYNYAVLMNDPIWNIYTAQNQTLSPPPSFYLWGFAPFWIFALPGIFFTLKRGDSSSGGMLAWAVSAFVLAYFPVAIQRRFLLGITIPLSILAIIGLEGVIQLAAPRWATKKSLLLAAYVSFAAVSTLYFILGSAMHLTTLPENRFYPRPMQRALLWLDQNAQPDDLVLSSFETGELVAQYTRQRVYLGHKIETLYFERKAKEMKAFYNNQNSPRWLKQSSARWVIYSDYEKSLLEEGANFNPPNAKIAYQADGVTIYRVTHP